MSPLVSDLTCSTTSTTGPQTRLWHSAGVAKVSTTGFLPTTSAKSVVSRSAPPACGCRSSRRRRRRRPASACGCGSPGRPGRGVRPLGVDLHGERVRADHAAVQARQRGDDGLAALREGHVGHVHGLGRHRVGGRRAALEGRLDDRRLGPGHERAAQTRAVAACRVQRDLGAGELLARRVEQREPRPVRRRAAAVDQADRRGQDRPLRGRSLEVSAGSSPWPSGSPPPTPSGRAGAAGSRTPPSRNLRPRPTRRRPGRRPGGSTETRVIDAPSWWDADRPRGRGAVPATPRP